MMKKYAALTAALGLAALISTSALAAGGDGTGPGAMMPAGGGPGYGYHHGWANMTPEQQAEAQKVRAEFMNETLALRQKIATKRAEYATLEAQPTRDTAKIKAVADELVDLHAQMAKKRNEFAAKYPNAFRHGFGHGAMMGGGMGAGMMGGGMGGFGGGGCGAGGSR